MKVHILYKFADGPWGGGNQFLKALRDYLIKNNSYSKNPEDAEIILFNSHQCLEKVFQLKKKFPYKIFVHRIDGPVNLIRGNDKVTDHLISQFNNLFADGTIFQSNWSMKKNHELKIGKSKYKEIIMNAPNNDIFKRKVMPCVNNDKIKLIATSWSSNMGKGFKIYKFLDENLNFHKYEMTFVGNSPVNFRNINWIKPISSERLAQILKEHDIFITASENDPCSNSLIEALSCGLPAAGLNSGGHPQIIANGGEVFDSEKDIIEKIEKIAENYEYYQSKVPVFPMDKIGHAYYEFMEKIYNDTLHGKYEPKQVNLSKIISYYKIMATNKIFEFI